MNPLEPATDATRRLEMRLGDFGIPGKFTDEIIDHHTVVNYNKGSMVSLQGSPADVMFWVLAGLVKVYCPRPDGTRILVKLAGPGEWRNVLAPSWASIPGAARRPCLGS